MNFIYLRKQSVGIQQE